MPLRLSRWLLSGVWHGVAWRVRRHFSLSLTHNLPAECSRTPTWTLDADALRALCQHLERRREGRGGPEPEPDVGGTHPRAILIPRVAPLSVDWPPLEQQMQQLSRLYS